MYLNAFWSEMLEDFEVFEGFKGFEGFEIFEDFEDSESFESFESFETPVKREGGLAQLGRASKCTSPGGCQPTETMESYAIPP